MLNYLLLFMFAVAVAAVLVPAARWLAFKVGAVDVPDARKVHRQPVPRLGGLAILAAFSLPVGTLYAFGPGVREATGLESSKIIILLAGGLFISMVGALDDTRGLKARVKLALQLLLAAATWLGGIRIVQIGLPFVGTVQFPVWFSFLFTVMWIAGIINAMNLIDGLDGLAAGVAFIVSATIFVLAARAGDQAALLFSTAMAGAVIGFLLFNWNPAIVFMGDSGSMFLGYVLSTTAVMTAQKMATAVAMVAPIIALGVPVVDTLLAIVRRFLEKRPIFSPDKGHLHHRLLRLGLTQRRAVVVVYGLCVLFAVSAILMTSRNRLDTAVALAVVVVLVVGVVRFFGLFNLSGFLKKTVGAGRLGRSIRRELPAFYQRALAGCSSSQELWQAFVDTAAKCGIEQVQWQVVGPGCADQQEHKTGSGRTRLVKYRTSVEIDGESYLELSLSFPQRLSRLSLESDEEALDLLADAVAAGVRKLKQEGRWQKSESEEKAKSGNHTDESLRKEEKNSLDSVWQLAQLLARQEGFLEIAWKSHGLKLPDSRHALLNNANGQQKAQITRSIPITSLSFLELKLTYPGRAGKKTPERFRDAARRISERLAAELVKINRPAG